MGADESGEQQQLQQGGLLAVGAALAAAREKKQISLTAVASTLHLGSDLLGALEAGDQSRLPAQAFVRGYIKSYARLVGLEEGPLLNQLPAASEQRAAPLKRVGMRRRRVSLPPIGRWLVRGALLAVVLLVLAYAAPLIERLWTDRDNAPVADALQIPQSGRDAESGTIAIDLPAGDAGQQPDVAGRPAGEEKITQALPPKAAEPRPAESAPAAAEQPGPAEVKLIFMEDSWVEMEARGRKLVVGMQPAGSERTVNAEPPISLLLGNAPAVKLSYRGKVVDLAPYQNGNVARVTLED